MISQFYIIRLFYNNYYVAYNFNTLYQDKNLGIHCRKFSSTFSPAEDGREDDDETSNFADWKKINTKNFIFEHSPGYNMIQDILNSKDKSNYDKQEEIEKAINTIWYQEILRIIGGRRTLGKDKIGTNLLAVEFTNLTSEITTFIQKKRKPIYRVLERVSPTLLLSIVLGRSIPFCIRYPDLNDQPIHSLFESVGDVIVKEVRNELSDQIQKSKIEKEESSKVLEELKILADFTDSDKISLGHEFVQLLSDNGKLVSLKTRYVSKNESVRCLIPKEKFISIINNITLIDSVELPMIIKPLEWKLDNNGNIEQYGGTIMNHTLKLKSYMAKSVENIGVKEIKLCKDIVNAINYMASIPYTINLELLQFITSNKFINRNKKGELIINFFLHEETDSISIYEKEYNFVKLKEISSHNSKYIYHSSILSIAKLMSIVPEFYVNVITDWRGRFYTSNCVLNIQGGELARSLLLFKNGEILNETGLKALKIYTANAFGHNKMSKIERIKWVNDNLQNILDIENNDKFWTQAEEPLLFLACAFELKGYYSNPNKFISRLPILMDATCNGLQHLSAMIHDMNLAEKVNLLMSKDEDKPYDLYTEIIPHIEKEVNDLVKKLPVHYNLKKINITRSLVKRGIMTITYGATQRGILEQIISQFFTKTIVSEFGKKHVKYVCSNDEIVGKQILFSWDDLIKLSGIIYNSLFKIHPGLKKLMDYFNDIVRLLCDLDLPVYWVTPYNLVIQQKYVNFTTYDITNYVSSRRYKITLRKPMKDSISKQKQVQAFIPNFVHSMDGSNIILLINYCLNKHSFNFASIHDCFACQANNAALLSHLVKQCFIRIYGDGEFISRFHKHIIERIEAKFGNDLIKDEKGWYVILDKGTNKPNPIKYRIPNEIEVVTFDLSENLLNSEYFIN